MTYCLFFCLGLALGGLFYYGLWWTISKKLTASRPIVWFVASFFVRIGLILCGLYCIGKQGMDDLAIALLGFIGARVIMSLLMRRPDVQKDVAVRMRREDSNDNQY